jgi:creatinine amidohydrolase
MRLHLMTWPEVEAYLGVSAGIIIPIGATEQHGPTGLIGTDAICAETLAWRVGRAVDAVVGPTLGLGMSAHHLAFPGSVTLRPTTLVAVLQDLVGSLAVHGFRRFFFVNGHGGNTATAQAAFAEIYATAPRDWRDELRCAIVSWWEGEATQGVLTQLFGDREGRHATPGEISIALQVHPDERRVLELIPPVAPVAEFFSAADFRARFPDGRIGSDPTLASAAHGEAIALAAVAELAEAYREFLAAD